MAEEQDKPYELEPEPAQPAPTPPAPQPAAPAAKAKLEAAPLLQDFEEDADFDKDPEVEAVITGKKPGAAGDEPVKLAPELPEFIKPALGDARTWAIGGAVLVVGALVLTGINAERSPVARIALTLYTTLLHTGTGVVALYIASLLTDHQMKRFELAAARMLVAVAAFQAVFHTQIVVIQQVGKLEETVIAAAVYALAVAGAFRLWRTSLAYVLGAHFLLWIIVEIGMQLAAWADAAPAAARGAGS